MDLTPLGYSTFHAFCAAEVEGCDTRIRQLIALVESPFAKVRAAVVAGRLAPSVAIRGVRVLSPEEEEQWLEDAIAGHFSRARREPDPEVEHTGEDVVAIHAARTLARLNLGQPVTDPTADRHILAACRANTPGHPLQRLDPPPAPAPLPPSTPALDPADEWVGPWQDPTDPGHALALLRLVSALRLDRVRQLGAALAFIAQGRLYEIAGFRSFEAWARRSLSIDVRTVQRYRKALNDSPELDLDRALFLEDIAADDTREAWRAIVPRVPAAELERVRVHARRGAEAALREAYTQAIAEVDAIPALATRAVLPSLPGVPTLQPEGATNGAKPRLVSLARTLLPPRAPRATPAHPDLPTAARWYLLHGKPPKQRGIGRIKERDHFTCVNPECGARSLRAQVHHRVFRSHGGTDSPANLQTHCPACHLRLIHSGHLRVRSHGA